MSKARSLPREAIARLARAGLSIVALMAPVRAFGAWPADPDVNLPVCVSDGVQDAPALVSDGAGGAIVVWQNDLRDGNVKISAQRVDSTGTPVWAPNGVDICDAVGGRRFPRIASDGAAGAIVVWQDFRNGVNWDVYAQRVAANGSLLWGERGVALSMARDDQLNCVLAADGRGGAIVSWEDRRDGSSSDIYAQHVTRSGRVAWAADGIPVCVAPGVQMIPQIVTDGTDGVIITWQDRPAAGGNMGIHAQRVSRKGRRLWSTDGVVVSDDVGMNAHPMPISDAAGGAVIVWDDGFIFAQRVSAAGKLLWTKDGVTLSAGDGALPMAFLYGAGAFVVWQDSRGGQIQGDIFAQSVGLDGGVSWDRGGVAVCTAANVQTSAAIAGDGTGGALIVWQDRRGDTSGDIYAQRVDHTGVTQWPPDGVLLCSAHGAQQAPSLVPDGGGGAIVVWKDERSGEHIFAQRVDGAGQLGGATRPR